MSAAAWPVGAECNRTWRDKPYRETLSLRDGRSVTLRPTHRSDAPALKDFFFGGLSPRARLLRFHGTVNDLPEAALRMLTTQIPRRHVALAAMATTHDGVPRLLAEARYVVDDEGEPEFAVAVADMWQGQGLGRALVLRLGRACTRRRLRGAAGHGGAGQRADAALGDEAGRRVARTCAGGEGAIAAVVVGLRSAPW